MRRLSAWPTPLIIVVALVAAVIINLVVYAIGLAAGASYAFTTPTGAARVEPVVVIGFTVVPLGLGLIVAALLGRRWPRLLTVAAVVAAVLAVGTIFLLTLPSDHGPVAKLALSACHVTLVPVALVALTAMRRRYEQRRAGAVTPASA